MPLLPQPLALLRGVLMLCDDNKGSTVVEQPEDA